VAIYIGFLKYFTPIKRITNIFMNFEIAFYKLFHYTKTVS